MKLKIIKSGGFQGMLLEKEVNMEELKEDDQRLIVDFVNKKKTSAKRTEQISDQFQYEVILGADSVSFGEFELEPEDRPFHLKIESMLRP